MIDSCSTDAACVSVVHDENDMTCHYYNTVEGDVILGDKETAVAKERYSSVYGKYYNVCSFVKQIQVVNLQRKYSVPCDLHYSQFKYYSVPACSVV